MFVLERKQKLLNLVVENYIDTSEPVGSKFLLSSGEINCGEATIRNELRALEDEGYLTHPHTSAGRIPTVKGYRYYVDNLAEEKVKLAKKDNDILGLSVKSNKDYQISRKNLAKALVELSNQAVILAFSSNSVYYTGLANLFSQPEFSELRLVADISQVFDHCEQCLQDFFTQLEPTAFAMPAILIGREHPFGGMLSVVASRFSNKNVEDGLLALLGPMRMNYGKNLALMNRASALI